MKLKAESNKDPLKYDCILVMLGVEYHHFNAICCRTLLIDCSEEIKKNYAKCEKLLQTLIEKMRPGVSLKEIYGLGLKFLKDQIPAVELPTSFGAGVGLELKENLLLINEKADKVVEPGMVFNISLGLNNLTDGKRNYAFLISDTVVVDAEKNLCLTGGVLRGVKDISYSFD